MIESATISVKDCYSFMNNSTEFRYEDVFEELRDLRLSKLRT